MEIKFDIGDKIRNINSGDVDTVIGIVLMYEFPTRSYYLVLSSKLSTHRIKFKTTEHYEKIDHCDNLEDVMTWVRKQDIG